MALAIIPMIRPNFSNTVQELNPVLCGEAAAVVLVLVEVTVTNITLPAGL